MDLDKVLSGDAELLNVRAGGVAVYQLADEDGECYLMEVDMSDVDRVGAGAVLERYYLDSRELSRFAARALADGAITRL